MSINLEAKRKAKLRDKLTKATSLEKWDDEKIKDPNFLRIERMSIPKRNNSYLNLIDP